MHKKLTTEEFLQRANFIHFNKFDYSLVNYIDSKTKVDIICHKHGFFKQTPENHMKGNGCPYCVGRHKNSLDIIKEFKNTHNEKYDYSKVVFKKMEQKVKITCFTHGVFLQTPYCHISGQGCPKCNGKNKTTEEFKKDVIKIHGHRYDYSKAVYINARTPLIIICKKHGEFSQNPYHHKAGNGCPICKFSKGESKIYKILKELNINFEFQKKFKNCKYIKSLLFDFYLKDYNTCVEFQGIQHYKEIEFFGGKKAFVELLEKDKIKEDYCKANNINLLKIKYDKDIKKEILKITF